METTSVSTNKNRDRILEAIDQLRRRKARPDVQRICNYLFRKFSVTSQQARTDLQWCVDQDVVLKVEYKGSISYRNAAKKYSHLYASANGDANIARRPPVIHPPQQQQQQLQQQQQMIVQQDNAHLTVQPLQRQVADHVPGKFNQLLTNALGELVVQEPDYLEYGVPAQEIVNHILSKDSVRYTKKYINILIEREVDGGGLIRMNNDNYLMGPAAALKTDEDENKVPIVMDNMVQTVVKVKKKPGPKPGFKKLQALHHELEERKNDGALRVGGRRKRAKKVFDPSDTHIPRKRGRPAGSLNKSTIEKQLAKLSDDSRPESRASNSSREQGGVCSVCHMQINAKKGPNDRMIACKECSNKAHYSCLKDGDDMMLKIYPDSSWQCPHCKTCIICYETSDAGSMVVCAVCADAYHTNCHQPRISDKVKASARWLCLNCEMPQEVKINEIGSAVNNTSFAHSLQKSVAPLDNDEDHDSSSPSLSGNSSLYQSPPMSPTPPHLSPQLEQRHANSSPPTLILTSDSQSNRDSEEDYNVDPSIPDASGWSAEEVFQYFRKYFPEEAHIFREQDIDGRSLLLLRRLDVLTNLRLKLGPALKIYRHVVKLQVRRDDPKFYWL